MPRASICLALMGLALGQTANAELNLPDAHCSFSGHFQQTKSVAGIDVPLRSNGVFYYHCQHGVIWATIDPIIEVLSVDPNGRGHIKKGAQTARLTSRQGRFLGGLLNGLMSGDQTTITQQFAIEDLDQSGRQFRLLPRKRTIKRAIQSVTVSIPDDDKLDQEEIRIVIVDRNDQRTEIRSIRSATYHDGDPLTHCLSVSNEVSGDCARLLIPTGATE